MKKKRIYPAEWIWPFRPIFNFFYYLRYIKTLDAEDIGRMRYKIHRLGFSQGMESFEIYITGKCAMNAYDMKKQLQDLADGKEPGSTQREFDEKVKAQKELELSRARKQALMQELKKEIKYAELDRIKEEDIIASIEKMKKFGAKK